MRKDAERMREGEPTVYYECTKCRYKMFSRQRCGPKYLECYACGYSMPWKPMQYR